MFTHHLQVGLFDMNDTFTELARNAAAMNAAEPHWSDDPRFDSKEHYDDVMAGRRSHNSEVDELLKHKHESVQEFNARIPLDHPDRVEECAKREYAKISGEERALWLRNPFEPRTGSYNSVIDDERDLVTYDQSGKLHL